METGRVPLIDTPEPHGSRVAALVAAFRARFGAEPEGIAEAPGRVNLIGEHVDYNDGLVLPFAINRSVMCAYGRNPARAVRAYSTDYDHEAQVELDEPGQVSAPGAWEAYVRAVVEVSRETSLPLGGLNLAIAGDVPQGAGLSSSAALEVAVLGAFRAAFGIELGTQDLALLCQRAESEHVGVACGIMDQFASALSQRGHALLIDCRRLAHKTVPLRLAEHGLTIVIANSAVRRELVHSAYNERRRECGEALAMLREALGKPALASLRDVRWPDLERAAAEADDGVMRRARHVVSEIDRVAEAADALERDDFARVGELMVESHRSLREDFGVSSAELDLLVGLATAQDYVLGARLTGAGFGGCTVNVVQTAAVEAFARDVVGAYTDRTGLAAVAYVSTPEDGLRLLEG